MLCLAASASYGASYVYVGRFLSNTGLSSVVLSAGQLTAAAGWLTLSLPAGGLTVPAWRADAVTALGIPGIPGIPGSGAAYVLNVALTRSTRRIARAEA